MSNLNTGHGWVNPRPDGMKARCGGPGMCRQCALERAQKQAGYQTDPTWADKIVADALRLDEVKRLGT